MAFCNSCGATLDAGTKFCNKCGAAVPAASAPAAPAAGTTTPAQGGGGNAVKIILIVVAVIVGLALIFAGVGAYLVHRAYVKVRDNARIEQKDGKVKIESPFGNLETSTDPSEAAKSVGVDLYPGAEVSKNGTATMTIGGMHTATAVLETSDSPDQVAAFYKSKLPNTTYSSNQGSHYSMMAGNKDDMTTINIEGQGEKTTIQISRVTKAKD